MSRKSYRVSFHGQPRVSARRDHRPTRNGECGNGEFGNGEFGNGEFGNGEFGTVGFGTVGFDRSRFGAVPLFHLQ